MFYNSALVVNLGHRAVGRVSPSFSQRQCFDEVEISLESSSTEGPHKNQVRPHHSMRQRLTATCLVLTPSRATRSDGRANSWQFLNAVRLCHGIFFLL